MQTRTQMTIRGKTWMTCAAALLAWAGVTASADQQSDDAANTLQHDGLNRAPFPLSAGVLGHHSFEMLSAGDPLPFEFPNQSGPAPRGVQLPHPPLANGPYINF